MIAALPATNTNVKTCIQFSKFLEREVIFDIYYPSNPVHKSLPCLLINDGQDLRRMNFETLLTQLYQAQKIESLIVVGIHCGAERKREYGVAYSADYLNRGDKAGRYTKYFLEEFIPFLKKMLQPLPPKVFSIAGFSLGGLTALDIAWNHPQFFNTVGLFSPSLWWRRNSYENGYQDEWDRLMHLQIKLSPNTPDLRYFIQCGNMDETADRNKNGIIDSIEDAIDLIQILETKNTPKKSIFYYEIKDGRHDVDTWKKALPVFLQWAFPPR